MFTARSVDFTSLIDLLHSKGGSSKDFFDLIRCLFSNIESVNELNVLKNVLGLYIVQELKDLIFKINLLLVVLFNLLYLFTTLGLNLWLLRLDDKLEALVFKTIFLNLEVDDCNLGRYLGSIMRVADSGGDVELEVLVPFDLFLTNLDGLYFANSCN